MNRGTVFTVIVSTLLLAGCAKETPIAPPTVRYGVDACSECGMIISDERYAAALIADESGSGRHVYMYDDIGCLLDHERQLAGRTIRARYVHDVTSKQWVESEQAYFARSPKVQTPMASGIIAASFKADVEQQAGAPAVRFADLGGAEAAAAASAPAGDSAKGKALFAMTCIACHGPEGQGVPNVGLPLHTSEFVASKTDQQLVDFIKVGRMPGSPEAKTMIPMPPKGGNPTLTDEQLLDIAAYLRQLQQQPTTADSGAAIPAATAESNRVATQ
jgi:disulfide bond formation protein DsbB